MDTSNKRLVLAYPPYSTATAPPLGLCALKGFLRQTLPEWSVKVLDLNLLAHQELFGELAGRLCAPGPNFIERLLSEALLSRTAETFLGQHGQEFYDRPDRYFLGTRIWLERVLPALANDVALEKAYRHDAELPECYGRYAQAVLNEQPGIIGLSICYTQQLWPALCLAKALKQRSSAPIIAGGTYFNTGADAFLRAHAGCIDYVVTGEGEWPLAKFLQEHADLAQVPGLTYAQAGGLLQNPPMLEEDLDVLGTPDFSDLDLRAYYSPAPVVPVLTSRGCYWRRCAFCAHYKSAGQTYRRRSVAKVVEELARHVQAGVTHFALVDEMISPAHFAQLAQAIIDAGLKIHYYALAKPVKQFDAQLLALMGKSGCRFILWGVESGSQRLLDLMDKGTKVSEVEAVLETAAAEGVKNHLFVMFGFPTETRQEFQATLDLLARHKQAISMVHRGLFQLESGSPVFEHPEKFSITRCAPTAVPLLYQFECASGMNRQEVRQAFAENISFLRKFGSDFTEFGDFRFRDHALLIYSRAAQEQ